MAGQSVAATRCADGVDASRTVAIGDGANDIPMIEAAGLGVAYHAKPRTRAAADAAIERGDLGTLLHALGHAHAGLGSIPAHPHRRLPLLPSGLASAYAARPPTPAAPGAAAATPPLLLTPPPASPWTRPTLHPRRGRAGATLTSGLVPPLPAGERPPRRP